MTPRDALRPIPSPTVPPNMPTYEYVCRACAKRIEYFQSMSEAPKKKCPECGKSKLERQIGPGAGVLFKGSGFYQTDYRSDSYKSAQKADKETATPAESSSSKTDGAKSGSDAKPTEAKKKPSKSDG